MVVIIFSYIYGRDEKELYILYILSVVCVSGFKFAGTLVLCMEHLTVSLFVCSSGGNV